MTCKNIKPFVYVLNLKFKGLENIILNIYLCGLYIMYRYFLHARRDNFTTVVLLCIYICKNKKLFVKFLMMYTDE